MLMRAAVQKRYGPPSVMSVRAVPRPAVSADTLLVRVKAAAVNPYDWRFMRGKPNLLRLKSGILGPKVPILGVDFAGVVEDVGAAVTGYAVGDGVFGLKAGTFAEYLTAHPAQITKKPTTLSFEEAAGVPASAYTSLQALRNCGDIKPGMHVLINGASGGVGTFAVQLAKYFGVHVTAVCSGRNAELVANLGADDVIDYTQTDLAALQRCFDIVLDNVGNHSVSLFERLRTPEGTYVAVAGKISRLLWLAVRKPARSVTMFGNPNPADLEFLRTLLEDRTLRVVIDRIFPLEQVGEAIGYLEAGRARGKVIVSMETV